MQHVLTIESTTVSALDVKPGGKPPRDGEMRRGAGAGRRDPGGHRPAARCKRCAGQFSRDQRKLNDGRFAGIAARVAGVWRGQGKSMDEAMERFRHGPNPMERGRVTGIRSTLGLEDFAADGSPALGENRGGRLRAGMVIRW